MKPDRLLDSIGYIEIEFIEEAHEKVRHKNTWIKWTAAAASLLLVSAGVLAGINRVHPMKSYDTASFSISQEAPAMAEAIAEEEANEMPCMEEACDISDMMAVLVYKGNIYNSSFVLEGESADDYLQYLGENLGYTAGTINEWSDPRVYDSELASNVSGEVYTVTGYEETFRLCILFYSSEDGSYKYIQVFDHIDTDSIKYGKQLFEDCLGLSEHVTAIKWQSHENWNMAVQEFTDADPEDPVWKAFLRAADEAPYVNEMEGVDIMNEETVYDIPDQVHIILTMDDGTEISMRLIKGGYFGYEAQIWYFAELPGDAFDALFTAYGGTLH